MMVLRVERPSHEGPFRDLDRIHDLAEIGFPCEDGLPTPYEEDGRPLDWLDYVCGCVSWEQMRIWFSEEQIAWLQGIGFQVACYEVPDEHVFVLKYQCLFCLTYAVLVPLEEYNATVKSKDRTEPPGHHSLTAVVGRKRALG